MTVARWPDLDPGSPAGRRPRLLSQGARSVIRSPAGVARETGEGRVGRPRCDGPAPREAPFHLKPMAPSRERLASLIRGAGSAGHAGPARPASQAFGPLPGGVGLPFRLAPHLGPAVLLALGL